MNLILAILGIGFLIFIHELGHFLAAKFVGVKVHTFAVGFQPTIFGWKARLLAFTWGETEYVIGLVPLGGYVKMAGEDPGEERTDADDEFHRKPIPARLLVLVAGAAMNLIFGLILFALAFTAGVKQMSPVVGMTDPGGPAWTSGVKSGDRILAVNGDEWSDYSNVATAIALAGGSKPVNLTIDRSDNNDDSAAPREISVNPVWNPVDGRYRIGIYPASSNTVAAVESDSPAAKAGLREGDQIQSIRLNIPSDELVMTSPANLPADLLIRSLRSMRQSTAEGVLDLELLRDGKSETASLPLSPPPAVEGATGSLGILARSRTILASRSPADSFFKPGDEVVSLQCGSEKLIPVEVLDLYTVEKAARQRDLLLQCRLLDGRTVQVQSANLRRWLLEDLIIGTSTRWVSKAGPEAESLGITEGCQILRIGDTFAGVTEYIDAPLPGGTLVQWITATEPKTLQSTRLTEEKNLRLSLMQECVIGRTLAGSPARNSGVKDGSTVVSINGVRIDEWSQITPAIQASEGPVTLALMAPGSKEAEELIVTPAPLMASLGLQMAALQFREELPVGAAISAGMDQSWIWGGRIFLTLKALFSGDVHGKNLNGPVGIIDLGRKVSQVGFGNLLFLLALISINLGIFNLLPFPILDGGHILFLTIEGIRGKPVPDSIQNTIHLVAFMLLISMALFVTYNDLLRLW